MKIAFITGITGQDGSYLADLLLSKDYLVYGLIRRSSSINTERLEHILSKLQLRYGDVTDSSSLVSILMEIKNKHFKDTSQVLEIYNLAAQSHVAVSFYVPLFSSQTTGVGTLYLLEAIRTCDMIESTRFYQASSSEMFGLVQTIPQNENTKFYPRSPYAVSKVFAHYMTINYRESYGLHASCGILFNHESERRAINFVTRKITLGIAKILNNVEKELVLGNLDAKRDWGFAGNYVYGMWLMLQQDKPDDYVLATNEQHSVREFVELCFAKKDIKIIWEGKDLNEVGKDSQTGRILIRVDSKYYRPCEVTTLLGDSTKAQTQLGWKIDTSFDQLVTNMLNYDCETIKKCEVRN